MNIGSRLRRRAMPGFPGYLIGVILRLCLDLANMSVIVDLGVGGNPLIEAGISLIATLIGGFIGHQMFCLVWPNLILLYPSLDVAWPPQTS